MDIGVEARELGASGRGALADCQSPRVAVVQHDIATTARPASDAYIVLDLRRIAASLLRSRMLFTANPTVPSALSGRHV